MSFVQLRTLLAVGALAAVMASPVAAQNEAVSKPADEAKSAQKGTEPDPLKRELTPEERKKRAKALWKELGETYKRWMEEDVRYILTDEERDAFLQLSNDEERDNFIEGFWQRRDPTPDTVENEMKDEHYRRIAYANERFAAGIPGWRTDRGRMYIVFGPPDEIESHPSGGSYVRPMEEGGGTTSTFPFEIWRYRYIEGIGQEVMIEFVDTCMCNDYHMTIDRSEKDALLHVPGAGLTMWEELGMSSKTERFTRGGLERLGQGPFNQGNDAKMFDRLELYAKLNRPQPVKFKDLEEVVTTKIRYNAMPFDVRADFVRVTSDTVLVPVTVQVRVGDMTMNTKEGIARGVVNIFGRVTTLTGRIAQTFEDTVSVAEPAELVEKLKNSPRVYWKAMPLRPGRYRLDIVVKDVNGDRMGTWSKSLLVPEFSEDKLAHSSLIIADMMERVARQNVGTGNFVIGQTKVRPRVEEAGGKPAVFKRNQQLNVWMQVYNLGVDKATNKPNANIEYEIINAVTNKPVLKTVQSTAEMNNASEQVTIEKTMALNTLEPGIYRISIKVDDQISKQTIAPSARFAVE